MIEKDRLLAITDGIIAVAATIMLLQLHVPEVLNGAAIREQLPTLFASIISFMQIFLAWHEHHDACADARFMNHRIMFINTLWLFCITLLPYATDLVGIHSNDIRAVIIYLTLLLAINIIIKIECKMIEDLNRINMRDQVFIHKLQKISICGIAIAAAVSLIMPFAAFIVVILMNVYSIYFICRYDVESSKKNQVKLGIADASEFENLDLGK